MSMTGLVEVSRVAMTQMTELLGAPAESVSELARGDDGGLRLHVEVVELERIPPSTTILASYQVETDEQGNVLAFQRFRYLRGEAG